MDKLWQLKDLFGPRKEEAEEELAVYLAGRKKLRRKSRFGVSVIGTGNIGRAVGLDIAANPRIGVDHFDMEIDRVFFIGRDYEKAKETANACEQMARDHGHAIPIQAIDKDSLKDALRETDVAVVAANSFKMERYKPDITQDQLFELGRANTPLIKELASRFAEANYQGGVLIVTSHPDILSYVFASESGIDPSRIWGCNHTDSVRYREVVKKLLEGEATDTWMGQLANRLNSVVFALAYGSHDLHVNIEPDTASWGPLPLKRLYQNEKDREKLQNAVEQKLREEIDKHGHTSPTTSRAVREILEAAFTELGVASVSTLLDFSDDGYFGEELKDARPQHPLYMGVPRFFNNFHAQETPFWADKEEREPWKGWFRKALDTEARERFYTSANAIQSQLEGIRDEGLFSGGVKLPVIGGGNADDIQIGEAELNEMRHRIDHPPLDTNAVLVARTKEGVNVYSCGDSGLLCSVPVTDSIDYSVDGKRISIMSKRTKKTAKGNVSERTKIETYSLDAEEPVLAGGFDTKKPLSNTLFLLGNRIFAASLEDNDEGVFEMDFSGNEKAVFRTEGNERIKAVLPFFLDGRLMVLGGGGNGIYLWESEDKSEPVYGKGRKMTDIQKHGGFIIGRSGSDKAYGFLFGRPDFRREIETLYGIAGGYLDGKAFRLATVKERGGEYFIEVDVFGSEERFMRGEGEQAAVVPAENNLPHSLFFGRNYLLFASDEGPHYVDLRLADRSARYKGNRVQLKGGKLYGVKFFPQL